MFKFKQFTIHQDNAPFKVGTDSLILGAWVPVSGDEMVLDIGTGTGVLALMVAQKLTTGQVLAVEPERTAFEIAQKNVEHSDFSSKVIAVNEPLQRLKPNQKFDLIITNPPYFISSTKNKDEASTRARHTEELKFEEIISFSKANLNPDGRLCLVLPKNEAQKFESLAEKEGLFLSKELLVSSFDQDDYKRKCMQFQLSEEHLHTEKLSVRNKRDKAYTQEYRELTKEFHLHF